MKRITYKTIRHKAGEPYTMSLVGRQAEVVVKAVNVGIDAHLEACNSPDRGDLFNWREDKLPPSDLFPQGAVIAVRLDCVVSLDSLPVLLRRLSEVTEGGPEDGTDMDVAEFLVVDILESIGIEVDAGEYEIVNK